ncbi:hypothetical protein NUW54_g2437 [Trametes sanguinea]|uniref:Uncharacterized protein n=1 Tax=Trametes sanguinea TaxID=158606 RepID=A0ACC1Q6E9_9APHY|nr:hypothetical protein NUW54_g2437 [Trametes sanguinea]
MRAKHLRRPASADCDRLTRRGALAKGDNAPGGEGRAAGYHTAQHSSASPSLVWQGSRAGTGVLDGGVRMRSRVVGVREKIDASRAADGSLVLSCPPYAY